MHERDLERVAFRSDPAVVCGIRGLRAAYQQDNTVALCVEPIKGVASVSVVGWCVGWLPRMSFLVELHGVPNMTRRERRYRLTEARFETIMREQGGLCACCKSKKPVDVDHCHTTGHFRGLLCRACNLGLGMFGDDIAKLKEAISYLQTPTQRLSDRLPIAKRWTGRPHEKGEKSYSAKLTDEKVRSMRAEYESGGISYAVLGAKYGIHPVSVGRVIRRVEWAHVV